MFINVWSMDFLYNDHTSVDVIVFDYKYFIFNNYCARRNDMGLIHNIKCRKVIISIFI